MLRSAAQCHQGLGRPGRWPEVSLPGSGPTLAPLHTAWKLGASCWVAVCQAAAPTPRVAWPKHVHQGCLRELRSWLVCCLKVCTSPAGIDELIRHKDTERLCSFYVDLLPELARIQVMPVAVRDRVTPGGSSKGRPSREASALLSTSARSPACACNGCEQGAAAARPSCVGSQRPVVCPRATNVHRSHKSWCLPAGHR